MQEFDLLFRGAALGCAFLHAVGLILSPTPQRKTYALITFFCMIGCYLLVSSPNLEASLGRAEGILVVGATLAPFAFTWAVLEILFDEITDKWPWLVCAAIVSVLGLFVSSFPILGTVRGVLGLLLHVGILILAVITGADDLVEKRRVFRRWLTVVMALFGLVISSVELGFNDADLSPLIFPIQAVAFFVLSVIFGAWMFAVSPQIWPLPEPAGIRPEGQRSSKDNQLVVKLMQVMKDEIWREEGLTIGTLAEKLKVPEHRLRVVINQNLNFRNFSTFINGYRILAAMQSLDDPEQYNRTILEIAYDIGFSSLGPFNKAFRLHTGKNPREYRADSTRHF